MSDWLYQIRIKVSEKLSKDLRNVNGSRLAKEINKIASQMADFIKLPEDKRWAPILHFATWQKIFNMNI